MRLYLVQHGEALSKQVDPGRPLSPKGERDVAQLTETLNKAGAIVDRILHSGKMRAHQTAEILAEILLVRGETEAVEGINPNDPVQEFCSKIQKLKHDTMVVGHLPFLAKLVSYLTTGKEDLDIVAYEPGSVVCLEQDAEQQWRICWMQRPDFIKNYYTT